MTVHHWLAVMLSFGSLFTIAATEDPAKRIDPYTMLPQPMSADEIPEFARTLEMSEEQQFFARSLFLRYTEARSAIWPRVDELNRRELARRSQGTIAFGEVVQESPILSLTERYEEARTIIAHSRQIETEIGSLEDQYFHELSAILTEAQLAKLHKIQRARKRVRYQVTTESLPGAQVDLIALTRALKILPTGDSFGEILSGYESRLANLLELRHAAQRRVHLNDLKWLSEHFGRGGVSTVALEARGRIRLPQIRIESNIRQLNVSTVEALSILLSHDDAVRLFDEFEKAAHPSWSFQQTPDPAARHDVLVESTRRLLDDAASQVNIDEDASSEIEYLRGHFHLNYRRIQRGLSDADFNFRERVDRTMSARPDDLAAQEEVIAALLQERQRLCERIARRVKDLLEEHQSRSTSGE